jgi:hypothetical protein
MGRAIEGLGCSRVGWVVLVVDAIRVRAGDISRNSVLGQGCEGAEGGEGGMEVQHQLTIDHSHATCDRCILRHWGGGLNKFVKEIRKEKQTILLTTSSGDMVGTVSVLCACVRNIYESHKLYGHPATYCITMFWPLCYTTGELLRLPHREGS